MIYPDDYLIEWKNNPNKLPLIIKGARQIGKTDAVRNFGKSYKYFIEINFALQKEFLDIFDNGYEVDSIIRSIMRILLWRFNDNYSQLRLYRKRDK